MPEPQPATLVKPGLGDQIGHRLSVEQRGRHTTQHNGVAGFIVVVHGHNASVFAGI
jgi:hypothetical protein